MVSHPSNECANRRLSQIWSPSTLCTWLMFQHHAACCEFDFGSNLKYSSQFVLFELQQRSKRRSVSSPTKTVSFDAADSIAVCATSTSASASAWMTTMLSCCKWLESSVMNLCLLVLLDKNTSFFIEHIISPVKRTSAATPDLSRLLWVLPFVDGPFW